VPRNSVNPKRLGPPLDFYEIRGAHIFDYSINLLLRFAIFATQHERLANQQPVQLE
jgi:hypothetical protein